MQRIDWVRSALNNWALWHAREASGGLGYATQSVLLANPVDASRECPLPIDEVDAGLMDKAVASLKVPAPHLHETLRLYYLKGVGIKGAAAAMGRAESTVSANLAHADHKLAQWFTERKERQAAAKKSFST